MSILYSIQFRRAVSLSLIALAVAKSAFECFLTSAQVASLVPLDDPFSVFVVQNVMREMRLDSDEIPHIKLYIGEQNRCIGSRFSYPCAAIELEPWVIQGLLSTSFSRLDLNAKALRLKAFRSNPFLPLELGLMYHPLSLECRGIVGHEIAHYKLNHSLKAALLPSWLLLSSLIYIYSPKVSVLPLFAYLYSLHAFHQRSELEADTYAAKALGPEVTNALISRHRAKIALKEARSGAFIRWMKEDLPVWLFHVSPEKRIENLKKL